MILAGKFHRGGTGVSKPEVGGKFELLVGNLEGDGWRRCLRLGRGGFIWLIDLVVDGLLLKRLDGLMLVGVCG